MCNPATPAVMNDDLRRRGGGGFFPEANPHREMEIVTYVAGRRAGAQDRWHGFGDQARRRWYMSAENRPGGPQSSTFSKTEACLHLLSNFWMFAEKQGLKPALRQITSIAKTKSAGSYGLVASPEWAVMAPVRNSARTMSCYATFAVSTGRRRWKP